MKKIIKCLIIVIILTIGYLYRLSAKNNSINTASSKINRVSEIKVNYTFYDPTFEKFSDEEKRKALFYTKLPGDIVYGNEDAKVIVINFFNYNCYYCKEFEKTVFNDLKTNYIDKGLIKLVYRPLDSKATILMTSSLVCLRDETVADKIHKEFFNLENKRNKTLESFILDSIRKYKNIPEDNVLSECILNQSQLEQLVYLQNNNRRYFNIKGTPKFVINGKEFDGFLKYKKLSSLIDEELNKETK